MSAHWSSQAAADEVEHNRRTWDNAIAREDAAAARDAWWNALLAGGADEPRPPLEDAPSTLRSTCDWCGSVHLGQPDSRAWECCDARIAWAEVSLESDRLRHSLIHAAQGIAAVQTTRDFEAVPWPVSFDLAGVISGIRSALEVGR